MATYTFASISAEQALAIGPGDTLRFESGTASQTTVIFRTDGACEVSVGTRTVVFGPGFPAIPRLQLTYADGSTLFVGTTSNNAETQPEGFGAMYGDAGDDTLTAYGIIGRDPVQNAGQTWLIQGNQGADRITAWSPAANTIYGGQGNDVITFDRGPAGAPLSQVDKGQFAQGNKGDDVISSGDGSDTLLGGQGNDVIFDSGGIGFANGNLGNDTLTGTGTLLGEDGNDHLSAGAGSIVNGGDGNDTIAAGGGSTIAGGEGADQIFGNGAVITGGGGADRIEVSGTATGDDGDDTLIAFNHLDATVSGGAGNDVLQVSNTGTLGVTLSAGDGLDTLTGGAGRDSLSGGTGADTFVINTLLPNIGAGTIDQILDWGADDRLRIKFTAAGYAETSAATLADAISSAQTMLGTSAVSQLAVQVGADVVVFSEVTFGLDRMETAILLVGRTLADISAGNFVT